MEILLTILLIAVIGTLCIVCFFIGAKIGQATAKGEEVKLPEIPNLNPVEAYNKHKEEKAIKEAYEKEVKKIQTIMENVENYDGTGANQKDVPM